jgi:hypothetical protein
MGLAAKALALIVAFAAIGFLGVAVFSDLPAPAQEVSLPIALR